MKYPAIHFMLALVAGVAMIALYSFLYLTVSHKSSAVAHIDSQITTAKENVSRMASARTALVEVSSTESQIQSYFVPESGVVTFINTIESLGLAEKAPVKVLSVSTGGSPAAPTLLIAMTITGTFEAVMRAVGVIEYAPYTISVSTLSVGKDGPNSWHANLTITVGSVSVATTTVPTKTL